MSDLDLDALSKLVAAMTPGPLHSDSEHPTSGYERVYAGTRTGPGLTVSQWMLPKDAAGFVALVNAAPALIAAARETAGWVAEYERNRTLIGEQAQRIAELEAALGEATSGDALHRVGCRYLAAIRGYLKARDGRAKPDESFCDCHLARLRAVLAKGGDHG